MLIKLLKQSKCKFLIIAINECVVIVHCSGKDLVQLDLGMTIKSGNSKQLEEIKHGDIKKKEVKMPSFSFPSVSTATDNFLDANKLGEGGFGPVYKV